MWRAGYQITGSGKATLVKLPEPDPATGFIPTLNRMGGMSPTLDEFSQAFVDFPGGAPLLDVGACYGLATLAALKNGATVWANDLEPAHLEILKNQVPPQDRDRLLLLPGAFPADIPWLPESLGAVLLARVLHYLDGRGIEEGLREIHAALIPGGRVFGVALTPYLPDLAPFHDEYSRRKQAGERWPGAISVKGGDDLPSGVNFLDDEILRRALTEAGFTIERLEYGAEGREALGFIAVKR